MREIIMLLLLVVVAITDIRFGKIPNQWILTGWFLSLGSCFVADGLEGGIWGLIRIVCMIGICLPVYLIHAIGAGDIKLWSVIAAMHGIGYTWNVMLVFFALAGAASLFQMLSQHILRQRMQYLFRYVFYLPKGQHYLSGQQNHTQCLIKLAPFTAIAYGVVVVGRWQGIC